MCPGHWRMVPEDLQAEVYRTVRMRGKAVDETWAPWWRAQAKAIDYVFRRELEGRADLTELERKDELAKADRRLAKDLAFANELEASA